MAVVDPFLPSARVVLTSALNELQGALSELDAEALNRRPGGDETNSLAVLAVHSLTSTRSWLSVATGAQLPERDRDAEFRATAGSADELREFVLGMGRDCQQLLDVDGPIDWTAMRATHARPNEEPEEVVASFALMHALAHLQEHVGQMLLTRQLLDGRVGRD